MDSFDVLVVGSGIAGLTVSLQLAPFKKVALLTKRKLSNASTYHAQGGIAAALAADDSLEAHVADTLTAGADLCDPIATQAILSRGTQVIHWLVSQGVPLSQTDNKQSLHLTQEGGHRARRIVHAADATGKIVHDTLVSKVKEHRNISIFEDCHVIDVITYDSPDTNRRSACGVYVFEKQTREVFPLQGKDIILATGGASGIYRHTTHVDAPVGEGIAMAWRAGCTVANLEFTQFHPTSLYHPDSPPFLISEALRGEGAILRCKTPDGGCGDRFMLTYDRRAELAPRDIVARAIDQEIKISGEDHVWLDISHQPAAFIKDHFPTIYAHCYSLGIDITRMPIPVVPAAHYSCGGVLTDLKGKTLVDHLYAIGETAYTGLHGANRLASNSLLECLVFGFAAAESILESVSDPLPILPPWPYPIDDHEVGDETLTRVEEALKKIMWDHVGIVRNNLSLNAAIEALKRVKTAMSWLMLPAAEPKRIELRNRVIVADLTIRSALARKESRGLHYTIDYPNGLAQKAPTFLSPS